VKRNQGRDKELTASNRVERKGRLLKDKFKARI
jgi:hypothetical protein